jgi:hypothetical protein
VENSSGPQQKKTKIKIRTAFGGLHKTAQATPAQKANRTGGKKRRPKL